MKTVTLFCLLSFCAATATEAVASRPLAASTAQVQTTAKPPKGFLGLLKGKKYKPHKPAYRRTR